ncbi:MAG: OsmC family protein [Eubacteriales bacterium]
MFSCAAYASCFHITLCKLLDKEKLSYEQVIVSVDLDRSVEGQTKFLYQCEIATGS